MQDHLTYRDATLRDIEKLKELAMVSYGQYAPLLTEDNLATLKRIVYDDDAWKNILAKSKSFTCSLDDEIIGMAFLIPSGNPWDIFKAEWAYLRMVCVNPAHQGKGIAKVLTRQCIDHARATHEKTIALHTAEIMSAARHIYENEGFKILKEIEPRLGVRYWIYTLNLD